MKYFWLIIFIISLLMMLFITIGAYFTHTPANQLNTKPKIVFYSCFAICLISITIFSIQTGV